VRTVLEFERLTPEPGPDADAVSHEYVARMTLDGGPAALEIDGIATVWELQVDGMPVTSGRSMFERQVVQLSGLGPGEHEVRIVVQPLTELLDAMPKRPRQRWRTMLVEDARLRWARTQLLGRAPGFSPGPPVVGPYRPVVLVTGERPRPVLRARLEGSTGVVEVGGRDRVEFPDVELWWPHTHGAPRLHDVVVDGEVVGRVGFRTIENRSPDSLDLWVNGVRVFCRGAVWTPGDLGALDEAVTLGLNLVRVPGIAAYESDAFHARCDELGLLVWQDLMFATFDYPLADEEFVATVEAEVRDQARRLLGHPSTVVVCGSAEHEQQAAMFGVSG
jgi:beta-mannosidase